jgi:hypothetical protein
MHIPKKATFRRRKKAKEKGLSCRRKRSTMARVRTGRMKMAISIRYSRRVKG